MTYGHKTQSRSFDTAPEVFDRMVADGAINASEWVVAPKPPNYDPTLQNPPAWVNGAWLVTAFTPEELLARSDQAAVTAEQDQERAKIREVVGDLKAGTGTVAQRLTRLERVGVFLLRNTLVLLLTATFSFAGVRVITVVDPPLPADNVKGYIYYRRTGTAAAPIWTMLKQFGPTPRFDITEFGPGTYAVTAFNDGGESDKSDVVVIPGAPGKPLGFKVIIEFTP